MQQDTRQQTLENRRAEAERALEEQRAQIVLLQGYLDQMTQLVLEKSLRFQGGDLQIRELARARTLTVLEALDPVRKDNVLRFLVEDRLIQETGGSVPVVLAAADLHGVDLPEADMKGAVMEDVDLTEAKLQAANLSDADLTNADLSKANLEEATFEGASLNNADLHGANLSLLEKDERDALFGAPRRNEAGFSSASFVTVDQLADADLTGATLKGARVTREQLDQAASLEGATMPNGQKYEDWIKDRKGHGKDGENPDSS